jgi:ferredoxin-like protein FixX
VRCSVNKARKQRNNRTPIGVLGKSQHRTMAENRFDKDDGTVEVTFQLDREAVKISIKKLNLSIPVQCFKAVEYGRVN